MTLIDERNESRYSFDGTYSDEGYDFINNVSPLGWKAIAGWGKNGWDLGDWPYVIVLAKTEKTDHSMMVYVEGDLWIRTWTTPEEREQAINETAWFYWRNNGEPWIESIAPGDEPEALHGPYR